MTDEEPFTVETVRRLAEIIKSKAAPVDGHCPTCGEGFYVVGPPSPTAIGDLICPCGYRGPGWPATRLHCKPEPLVDAVAICVPDPEAPGMVLVVDRREQPGVLCMPGGKVEHGESPLAAARRELFEETGIRLAPRRFRLLCAVEVESIVDSSTRLIVEVYLVTTTARPDLARAEAGMNPRMHPLDDLCDAARHGRFAGPASAARACLRPICSVAQVVDPVTGESFEVVDDVRPIA